MKNLKLMALIVVFANQSMASTLTLASRYEVVATGEKVKTQKTVELPNLSPLSNKKISFTVDRTN